MSRNKFVIFCFSLLVTIIVIGYQLNGLAKKKKELFNRIQFKLIMNQKSRITITKLKSGIIPTTPKIPLTGRNVSKKVLLETKLYRIKETINGKSYDISIMANEVPNPYCFSCQVYRGYELPIEQDIRIMKVNWLNDVILDVLFKWYKLNRYQYYLKDGNKRLLCNVLIDEKWKGNYCNRSTQYSSFYCEKNGINDKCAIAKDYRHIDGIAPIPKDEIKKYSKLFTPTYFWDNTIQSGTKRYEITKTPKNSKGLPLCVEWYNGENMERYYKTISMSEHDYSFTEIYKSYMNDILPLGFYLNNIWLYNTCYLEENNSKNWFEFYRNFVNAVQSNDVEKWKEIALHPYVKEKFKNQYIVFTGDSTQRMLVFLLYKIFRQQIIGTAHSTLYTYHDINDKMNLNLTFTYKPHGIPIYRRILTDYYMDIEHHLDMVVERFTKKELTPTIFVINYDSHPSAFAYSFYKQKLISISSKIVEVLNIVPNLKILFKGVGRQPRLSGGLPYTFSYSPHLRNALKIGSEYLQFMNSRFLHFVWKALDGQPSSVKKRFIFLNFRSLTDMLCTPDVHPCPQIMLQELFIMSRYF
ncbi:hypothetical protein SNEBB_010480 [Seison nebaliae]|nr:hypothetical protein SNEBB_010480 [Seison nebaliae]